MGLSSVVTFIHVLAAILGLGQVGAMVTLVSAKEGGPSGMAPVWAPLRRLARWGSYSLLVILLTGGLIDYAAGGAFHRAIWFKLSFLLMLFAGFLLGRAQGALKKSPEDATLRRVRQAAFGTTAVVAAITALMVFKPT
jgi:hypothetical protein